MTSIPNAFGRYQVVKRIGQGGMGALFLAWDPSLERQIAIKLLIENNDELRERLTREARAAARLRHPNIVTIFDVGDLDGQPFIAMEYIQGQTLAEIVRNRDSLTTTRKLELIEELCDGLRYAHAAGIVHRDVKPANAMVDGDGSLKILDFGIARAGDSSMTQTGMIMGTLNYMSPEQVAGQPVDRRSDIFAVGAVFYELLSYRQAFPGGLQTGILHKILHGQPEPLDSVCPGLDVEISRIVARALEKEPENRYQDLAAMLNDVQRVRLRVESDSQRGERQLSLTPRRTADREDLARRRTSQIQAHLDEAQRAFSAGEYERTIASCEQALLLSADDERAADLIERARAVLEERQAEALLAEAERELRRGALTAALKALERAALLTPTSPRIAELRQATQDAVLERERASQRNDSIRQAVATALADFDRGLYTEAAAAAEKALAVDPDHAEAAAIKAQALGALKAQEREVLDRRAREIAREARRVFGLGSHEAAFDLLVHFDGKHEIVSRTLDELRAESNRLAEERRLEVERRAKQRRVDAAVLGIRTDIDQQRFAPALDRLRALEQAEGESPEIRGLIKEAQDGQFALERGAREARELAKRREAEDRRLADERLARERQPAPTKALEKDNRANPPPSEALTVVIGKTGAPDPAVAVRTPTEPALVRPLPVTTPRTEINPAAPELRVRIAGDEGRQNHSRVLGVAAAIVVAAILGYIVLGRRSAPPTPTGGPPRAQVQNQNSAVNTTPSIPEGGARGGEVRAGGSASTSPAGPSSDEEQRMDALRRLARQQVTRGEWRQAVDTVASGLRLRSQDPDLRSILQELLTTEKSMLADARVGAVAAGASSAASPSYGQAQRREQDGARFEQSGRLEEAARANLEAAALFGKARGEASKLADQRPLPLPVQTPTAEHPQQVAAAPPTSPPVSSAPLESPPSAPAASPGTSPPPATSAAPPAPAPPPPARVPVSEESVIRDLVHAYADAYSRLDVDAVMRVFPTADAGALRTSFSRTKSQRVQILNEQISINGASAVVLCTWDTSFQGQAGAQQRDVRKTTLTLQKSGNAWAIVARR